MVAHAHKDAPYAESALAGRTLAAQSQLPKIVAENLGAGFGQWDFFPEAADVVDFALAYVSPQGPDDVWALARAWAADDAAARRTILALIGRDILQHELRRIDIPELRAFIDETHGARARELRAKLGLAMSGAMPSAGASTSVTSTSVTQTVTPKKRATVKGPAKPIPERMPKPEFRRPPPAAAPVAAKRFQHPKFGEGVLVAQQGAGEDAKLTIKFESGAKTLLARFVTELPT